MPGLLAECTRSDLASTDFFLSAELNEMNWVSKTLNIQRHIVVAILDYHQTRGLCLFPSVLFVSIIFLAPAYQKKSYHLKISNKIYL